MTTEAASVTPDTAETADAATKKSRSEAARAAVNRRWDSVREEREVWIEPFNALPVDKALRYLEDLRIIVERGGTILNERLNAHKNIRCAGPRCGKDLSGVRPNGMPKWIAQKVFRDANNPQLMRSIFFCTELCQNEWVRKTDGAGGSESRK